MATYKIVDGDQLDTDLASVANAIRSKGGTSGQLAFPAGFVNAVNALELSGGGGTEEVAGIFFTDYSPNHGECRKCVIRGIDYVPLYTGYYNAALQEVEIEMVRLIMDPTIGANAFMGCRAITSITFKGNARPIINRTAFNGCTQANLVINVPWAEGEVADAPWGATNATINYNCVG